MRFLLKHQTRARYTPRTCAFITLRDDRPFGLIEILSQG